MFDKLKSFFKKDKPEEAAPVTAYAPLPAVKPAASKAIKTPVAGDIYRADGSAKRVKLRNGTWIDV